MSTATVIPAPTVLETGRRHHAQNHLLQAAESYRQTLQSDPKNLQALLGLSLLARQSNQPEPALRMAHAALAAAQTPAGQSLAQAHLGHCLLALRQFESAKSVFQQALNPPPQAVPEPEVQKTALIQAHIGLAELLTATGHPSESIPHFNHALTLESNLAAAHYGLGNAHALEEHYSEAAVNFTRATQILPQNPEASFALAFTLAKLAQLPHAAALYRRALQLRPHFAAAWLNLGVTLIALGHPAQAEHCNQKALTSEPKNDSTKISAHLNLGHLHRSRKHFRHAQTHYESALQLASQIWEPHVSPLTHEITDAHTTSSLQHRLPEIHLAFTYLHLEQNQFPLAWQSLRDAELTQASQPNPNPEIPNARGILLLTEDAFFTWERICHPERREESAFLPSASTGFSPYLNTSQENGASAPEAKTPDSRNPLVEEAIEAFHQAESQGHKTAPSNRGNALLRLGRAHEALTAHEKAVQLDPYHPGARYNLALTQLRLGQYKQGWPNYESRWQFREVHPHPRNFPQPRWQGDPVPALLIYAEQGLGDTLQFLRYLPQVIQRMLASSTDPAAPCPDFETRGAPQRHLILEVQPPLTRLIQPCLKQLEKDHSSLTTHLIPSGQPHPPFTHHIPLLSLPALFETTLETVPNNIPYLTANPISDNRALHSRTIGLSWAGNPRYPSDRERSTHLLTFLPLLAIPDILWISLQKGKAANQIAHLPPEIHLTDASANDRDLADTAALIQTLDLVISTDTAVAHLAGALAKPLWLLLPWQCDWRWMQDRPDTPWYPTARLFRQPTPNNWPALIKQVTDQLSSIENRSQTSKPQITQPRISQSRPAQPRISQTQTAQPHPAQPQTSQRQIPQPQPAKRQIARRPR